MENELLYNLMKPKTLKDVIGQEHLTGEGKILNNLVKSKKPMSFILYGKPGTGKNSIADAFVNDLNLRYRKFNSTINNKKDLDIIFAEAKMYNGLIVIADEFHRLNKDKQDLFLEYLENGLISLIILTSENPYITINKAIRSRCQLFNLKEISKEDIYKALKKVKTKKILKNLNITDDALKLISEIARGDLRSAYNLLETAYYYTDNKINSSIIKEISPKASLHLDKNGNSYYDLLSALQKSIRGSEVDAALYYTGLLLERGDLDAIYRRLSVIAYEDVGLANPMIGVKVMAARENSLYVGLPEARIITSSIVIEMALSPKSNTGIIAIDKVINDINKEGDFNTPSNLKTSSNTYKYPFDYKNNYVKQDYLPKEKEGTKYYNPQDLGYEKNIKNYYDFINKLKDD